MSGRMKIAIAGVIIGFILLFLVPWEIGALIILAAIAVPVGAYLMLDPLPAAAAQEHPAAPQADPLGAPAGPGRSAQQARVEQRELVRVCGDQP